MSKKDYILIADAFVAAFRAAQPDPDQDEGIVTALMQVGGALASDNPQFDFPRWRKYIADRIK